MTLAFDTSILISIEKRDRKTLNELDSLSKNYPLPPQLLFMCYFEFLLGLKLRKPKKYDDLLIFLNKFNILHTTNKTADILSDLKVKYDKLGIALSLADLLIASQVIENNLILVTKDKDFEKIKEIKKIILE